MVALDAEYGAAAWEGVVYLYNGACGCDAYCGTWVCDSRADVEDINGDKVNICTAVPCDAVAAAYPCPTCTDTELPFVNVRSTDIASRFTVVATDCCDDVCPTTCDGGPGAKIDSCNNLWSYPGDYTVPDPILTAGGVTWTGFLGQSATLTIDSYQKVDYIVTATATTYLFKINWTITMGNFIEANGAYCTNGNPPNTVTSGLFYQELRVGVCVTIDDPDGGHCIGQTYISIDDALNVPFDFRNRGNPDPVRGNPCPNDTLFVDLTNYTGTSPVPEDECARYGTSTSSWAVARLNVGGSYPLGIDFTASNQPSAAFFWEMPITYPAL